MVDVERVDRMDMDDVRRASEDGTRVVCLLPDQNARNLEGLSVGWRGVIEARNDGWYWFVPDGDDDPVKLETGHAHLDWESNHPSDDPD